MSEWRRIASWPDYEVSEDGQVRRRTAGPSTFAGRLMKLQTDSASRLRVHFHTADRTQKVFVHHLVLEAFVGPRPSAEHECAHWDGNQQNNSRSNLRWALPKENAADKVRHGTQLSGERVPNAKLTWAEARQIRELAASGWVHERIAHRFGVSQVLVSRIVRNEAWREQRTHLGHQQEIGNGPETPF